MTKRGVLVQTLFMIIHLVSAINYSPVWSDRRYFLELDFYIYSASNCGTKIEYKISINLMAYSTDII